MQREAEKAAKEKHRRRKAAQKMLFAAVKLNEKVYNFFNEIILCSRGINKTRPFSFATIARGKK